MKGLDKVISEKRINLFLTNYKFVNLVEYNPYSKEVNELNCSELYD